MGFRYYSISQIQIASLVGHLPGSFYQDNKEDDNYEGRKGIKGNDGI